MNIGKVISALVLCASSWDDDKDRLLLLKDVYDISVTDEYVEVYFSDGNTGDVKIYQDGRVETNNDTTIPIQTDDGNLCCDACGCEIKEGQTICECCGRKVDWNK